MLRGRKALGALTRVVQKDDKRVVLYGCYFCLREFREFKVTLPNLPNLPKLPKHPSKICRGGKSVRSFIFIGKMNE